MACRRGRNEGGVDSAIEVKQKWARWSRPTVTSRLRHAMDRLAVAECRGCLDAARTRAFRPSHPSMAPESEPEFQPMAYGLAISERRNAARAGNDDACGGTRAVKSGLTIRPKPGAARIAVWRWNLRATRNQNYSVTAGPRSAKRTQWPTLTPRSRSTKRTQCQTLTARAPLRNEPNGRP